MTKPRSSTERSGVRKAALGFRAHSGWTAVVALGGLPRSPAVIGRRRVELVEPGIPNQPYHAAAKLDLAAAEKLIRECGDTARRLARQAIAAMREGLRAQGYEVAGCGLVSASGRPLPMLDAILSSHPKIHTAEGELFREALSQAARQLDLPLTRVRERELYGACAAQLRLPLEALQERIRQMGRRAGRPWAADEKQATLAAWLALLGA